MVVFKWGSEFPSPGVTRAIIKIGALSRINGFWRKVIKGESTC